MDKRRRAAEGSSDHAVSRRPFASRTGAGLLQTRLVRRLRPVRNWLAASVVVGLLLTGCLVAQAVLIGDVIAHLVRGRIVLHGLRTNLVVPRGLPLHSLTSELVALGIVAVVQGALTLLRGTGGVVAANATRAALRRELLAAVLVRGPSWVSSQNKGDLAITSGRGLDALDDYVANYLPRLALAAVAPLALLTAITLLNWESGVILIVVLLLVPIFMVLVGKLTEERVARRWDALLRLGTQFVEVVEGLVTLKAYGRARRQEARIAVTTEDLRRTTLAVLREAFLSALVLETLGAVGTALVAVPLALNLLAGRISLAPAVAVLMLTPEIFLLVRRASADYHGASEGLSALERAFDVIDGGLEHAEVLGDASVPSRGPRTLGRPGATGFALHLGDPEPLAVSMRAVSVMPVRTISTPRHPLPALRSSKRRLDPAPTSGSAPGPDGGAVLRDVDLSVALGEHLAVMGPSGSGKSTLLRAIVGLAPLAAGVIEVGGFDLSRDPPRQWRPLVGYVPQDPVLFSGTILENLLIGIGSERSCDPDRLDAALAVAQLDAWVARLPLGLHTQIGEHGSQLSGGERQRIAIARAVLRDPPIMVMDEPSSHLDNETEAALIAAMRRWLQGRTLVVATHRGPLATLVDHVMVLEAGQVVWVGEPDGRRHSSRLLAGGRDLR